MAFNDAVIDHDHSRILVENNRKIAHDLRSPLSALNFVSSMNPDLPDSSRELLKMAITRFEEIANRLDEENINPK